MEFFRWLCVSALAYLATVLYALLLGAACYAIAPHSDMWGLEGVAGFSAALKIAGLNGAYGGIVAAPLIGLWILRETNASVTHPDQEANWWRRTHVIMFKTFAAVLLFGLVLGGLCMVAGWMRGYEWPDLRAHLCWGLVWGSVVGGGSATVRAALLAFSHPDRQDR